MGGGYRDWRGVVRLGEPRAKRSTRISRRPAMRCGGIYGEFDLLHGCWLPTSAAAWPKATSNLSDRCFIYIIVYWYICNVNMYMYINSGARIKARGHSSAVGVRAHIPYSL